MKFNFLRMATESKRNTGESILDETNEPNNGNIVEFNSSVLQSMAKAWNKST